jgi:CheY-like chemotaxis protein
VLEQYGYHVTSAAGPAEAIDAARQTRFDLLVTDVVLRTGRGPALAQELRALDPQLKVLLISGYCETTVNRQDPLPNSHFLQKPFTPPTLAAKVRDVLAAGGHA